MGSKTHESQDKGGLHVNWTWGGLKTSTKEPNQKNRWLHDWREPSASKAPWAPWEVPTPWFLKQGSLFQGNGLPPLPFSIIVATIQKEAVSFHTKVSSKRQPWVLAGEEEIFRLEVPVGDLTPGVCLCQLKRSPRVNTQRVQILHC